MSRALLLIAAILAPSHSSARSTPSKSAPYCGETAVQTAPGVCLFRNACIFTGPEVCGQSPERYMTDYLRDVHYTPEQVKAVGGYSRWGYLNVNQFLRKIIKPEHLDEKSVTWLRGQIAGIDSAMDASRPIPCDTAVYRGVSYLRTGLLPQAGQIITDEAYTSTTLNRSYAERLGADDSYNFGALLIIRLTAGQKAIYMNHFYGAFWHFDQKCEDEMILPRGMKLQVLSIEEHPNRKIITLKAI